MRTQIFPTNETSVHCGSAPVQSAALVHSSEQNEPPSGPSTHKELEQSSPLVHESTPFLPVPRAPASQKQPVDSSHSQRSAAMQSRLNAHSSPGPPSPTATEASLVVDASSLPASEVVVPPELDDEEHATKSAPSDCDDADPNVHPGSTYAASVPRAAGGFDYDCDGRETIVTKVGGESKVCAAANLNCTQIDVAECDRATLCLAGGTDTSRGPACGANAETFYLVACARDEDGGGCTFAPRPTTGYETSTTFSCR